MGKLKFYEIDNDYIDFMNSLSPMMMHNKQSHQINQRKYIGIVLTVNGYNYFAPLSSFKPKHERMKNALDFIKIGNYAVINLNCMFPAPSALCKYVDFSAIKDEKYKSLLMAEYLIVKRQTKQINNNALNLYKHKINYGDSTPLACRCNDFLALEKACDSYSV